MAFSIVADDCSTALPMVGVETSSRWYCNVFVGRLDALISAGICTSDELTPQAGRAAGKTAFLLGGVPCPSSKRAWREPGYKAIALQRDGTYLVEITVSKEVQQRRLKGKEAAEHEREQARIVEEITASGQKYREWRLSQWCADSAEIWEGTKAQLQAAGLGLGMKFPGEPGATDTLDCKCPLGFQFRISQDTHNRAKTAAGIFRACSPYFPWSEVVPQYEPFAIDVVREVWMPDTASRCRDTYVGTAAGLVAAGVVPSPSYFPGQAQTNKTQVSYTDDAGAAVVRRDRHGRTPKTFILKRGNGGRFTVSKPVSAEEQQRREKLGELHTAERKRQEKALANERQRTRATAENLGKSDEDFRREREDRAVHVLDVLWRSVFAEQDGPTRFDLSEDGFMCGEIGKAFQAIRDAVQNTPLVRNRKHEAVAKTALKLVAAKNDSGLQAVLQAAQAAGALDAIRTRRD